MIWLKFGISLYFCRRNSTEQQLNSLRESSNQVFRASTNMEGKWKYFIPQHDFFFFGVIRNAQILWTLIRTQYLNSLFQVGHLYRDVSYPFLSFDWKPSAYQSFD